MSATEPDSIEKEDKKQPDLPRLYLQFGLEPEYKIFTFLNYIVLSKGKNRIKSAELDYFFV